MNIKGKHLELCRLIQCNYWITREEILKQGFEQSMLDSLINKKIILISHFNQAFKLGNRQINFRLPVNIQNQIGLPSKKIKKILCISKFQTKNIV